MKIFEYRPFLGSLSLGLERFSQNEVVEVANLPKITAFSYNNTHKQWFLSNFSSIQDYETQKEYDLAILNPNLGENIAKQGKPNFKITDLVDCLRFLEYEKPKFAIITVNINAIPLLNIAKDYVRDGFNQLSMDFVIDNLQKMGYKAHLVALDEASYGIPSHKHVAMYIATPNDFDLKFPEGLYNQFGRGKYNRYRTIADAIGDLGEMGEWSAYSCDAQNVYQRYIRRGMPRVTWHFLKRKVTDKQRDTIRCIRQGSNAQKTKKVRQNSGYNRPKWDKVSPPLGPRFYMVSGRYPNIHPLEDRPFTIREGMRILGLPDNISFELKVPLQDVAKIIVDSISPTIGEATALALKSIA